MGKAPDEIRGEIEDTRERMTETAEAIRYRTDVKTRAKEAVVEKKENLVEKAGAVVSRVAGAMPSPGDVASGATGVASSVGDAATSAGARVGEVLPDADQVKRQARQAVSVAQENPIGLAVGSLAVGFLAGMLIPRTRIEDEKIGDLSDEVKEKARDLGQEAAEQGRDLAQEVGQRAAEAARESAKERGQQLAESAQESAQRLTEAQSSAQSEQRETSASPPRQHPAAPDPAENATTGEHQPSSSGAMPHERPTGGQEGETAAAPKKEGSQ
jgi:Protein of unknown function (DUF3618)